MVERTLSKTLSNWDQKLSNEALVMPKHVNWDALKKAYELQPKNYEELLSIDGIGPNTARALALISELIYGEHADWKDPVKYSLSNTSLHLVEKLEKRIKKLEKELGN